jgi:hypothetical protein
MKKLFRLLLVCTTFFILAGCFDTTEEITIEKNGSGVYQVNADFSGFFELIESLKSMDTSANSSLKQIPSNIDTIIQLRTFTDTASDLSAEDKALLHDATVNLVMNDKDKVFKMLMKYPYKDINDVQKIIKLSQSGNNIIGKALQGKEAPQMDVQSGQGMPDFNNVYDITFKKGLIEKKINEDKLKQFQENEQMSSMKQAIEVMPEASISTVIHLPKPAKKAEGANVKLSDDKKTITIKSTLNELFNNPNSLSYRVEY